jgi:hypothetical protein
MCTHEIWTYSECGCTANHFVSCTESLRSRQNAGCLGQVSERWEDSSPPSPCDPGVKHTDIQSQCHRPCSISRTITKQFLEPICDDCLLHELGVAPPLEREKPLIWNSNVKIEVNESEVEDILPSDSGNAQSVNELGIFESNVEVEITEHTENELATRHTSRLPPQTDALQSSSRSSRLSLGDADSESSDVDGACRGRGRSRTKQIRRMAMDVSRENVRLRISSRLPYFQQRSLQNFKEGLQGRSADNTSRNTSSSRSPMRARPKPLKSILQRFAEVHSDGWSRAKETVQHLSRSISRKNRKARRRPRLEEDAATDALSETTSATMSNTTSNDHASGLSELQQSDTLPEQHVGMCSSKERLAQATMSASQQDAESHERPTPARVDYVESSISPDEPADKHFQSRDTWEEHLNHDLSSPRHIKHRHFIHRHGVDDTDDVFGGKAEVFPDAARPIGSSTSTAVSSGNWRVTRPSNSSDPFLHSSFEYSVKSFSDVHHSIESPEMKQRLMSSSSRPSIPATASDVSVSYQDHLNSARRLASLVSSVDFDREDPDGATTADEICFPSEKPTTPQTSSHSTVATPRTAIKEPVTAHRIDKLHTAASAKYALHTSRSTSALSQIVHRDSADTSPTPSPSGFQPQNTILALHTLSTPFHASLAPRNIDTILSTSEFADRPPPRPLPPTPSPSRSSNGHHPSTSPTTSSQSRVTELDSCPVIVAAERPPGKDEVKSCTWIRQLCPSAPGHRDCDRVVSMALGRCYCHCDSPDHDMDRSTDKKRIPLSRFSEGGHEPGVQINVSMSGGKESPLLGQQTGQGAPRVGQLDACQSLNPAVEYIMGLELCSVCLDTGVVVDRGGGKAR